MCSDSRSCRVVLQTRGLAHFNVLADSWTKHLFSHSNRTTRVRRRAGPGYDSDQVLKVSHSRELSRAGVWLESPFGQNPVGMILLQTQGHDCIILEIS